eukprot:3343971-Amphidinium_carterae.1
MLAQAVPAPQWQQAQQLVGSAAQAKQQSAGATPGAPATPTLCPQNVMQGLEVGAGAGTPLQIADTQLQTPGGTQLQTPGGTQLQAPDPGLGSNTIAVIQPVHS